MQGKTINGYTLQRLLGAGGMAEVWYAENKIGKKAAVKLLLPKFCADENIVARFQNEAMVMVQLEHPNIRQVYDYDEVDGRPCIIMEYLEGDDLKALLKQGHHFTDEELKKWWDQIEDALNYTHEKGIVHRDIKPSNIFLDRKDNIKLLDFGIAKNNEGGSGTMTGSTLGTRIYMSPEQVKDPKRVDYRTDLYSLAVTFVHLLTGKAPYDSTTSSDFEIQLSIVTKPLVLDGLPSDWRGFLEPYLEKEPDKRPALMEFTQKAPAVQVVDTHHTPAAQETESEVNEDATVMDTGDESELFHEKMVPDDEGTMVDEGFSAPDEYEEPEDEETPEEEDISEEEEDEEMVMRPDDLEMNVKGVSFVMKPVQAGEFCMGAQHSNGEVRTKKGYLRPSRNLSSLMDTWSVLGAHLAVVSEAEPDMVDFTIDRDAREDEMPVHMVELHGFYMGETVVTQALWKVVMGENPSHYEGDDLPVEQVSWNDCQVFIQKLNRLTGKKFRLPTEAEWEYAARGGDLSEGLKYPGSNSLNSAAWHRDNSKSMTHEVKQKAPNELGLYDLCGNVWEYCSDWYDATYYETCPLEDPQGPSSGKTRVIRGGSWNHPGKLCRVSLREGSDPEERTSTQGLRLALSQDKD